VGASRLRVNTTDSPDDEHRGARNMYRIGINIYEKRNVRHVGYLQEQSSCFWAHSPSSNFFFNEARRRHLSKLVKMWAWEQIYRAQWLSTAQSRGSTNGGVFLPWRRKQSRLPKRYTSLKKLLDLQSPKKQIMSVSRIK